MILLPAISIHYFSRRTKTPLVVAGWVVDQTKTPFLDLLGNKLDLPYPLFNMLTQYIQAAMRKARYEILDNNEGYYGEIPGFRGVYSNAKTLEECRDLLEEVLEEWVFLHIADRTPLPKVGGIRLKLNGLPRAVTS